MVFKLPSARCLSKASRDGALSENMANADINASLKGISTSSTRSSAMVAKFSRSKRKSASAQRCLRPFGTTMDIATLNLTSSTCEIVPMRVVLWPSCLRKARGDAGVVTGIYRPPGIADVRRIGTQPIFGDNELEMGVIVAQLRDEAFGGIALTVIFLAAILVDNRFGHQRNHFTPLGMNQGGTQHLMRIGDRTVTVMLGETRRTMNRFGGKIPRAIKGQQITVLEKHHVFKRFPAL